MNQVQVDLFSVLIAAIVYMVVGFLWYSKWLFGPTWLKLSDMKKADMKHPGKATFYGAINALVIAYFLAFFESYLGVTTVTDGMFVAFSIWLGFVATTQISPVIWCKASPKLFLITALNKLVAYVIMGGIIGA
jgi:hypothetical protein